MFAMTTRTTCWPLIFGKARKGAVLVIGIGIVTAVVFVIVQPVSSARLRDAVSASAARKHDNECLRGIRRPD